MYFEINGIIWLIERVNPYSTMLWTGDEYTLGVTDLRSQTVYISNLLHGDKLKDVISHEICHCMIASYGYSMDIPQEECFCQILEKYGDKVEWLSDMIYQEYR